MAWLLAEPVPGFTVTVDSDAVWIRSSTGNLREIVEANQAGTRLGRLLPALIGQLTEQGLASIEDGNLRIDHDDFASLEDQDIDAFDDLVPWAPFSVELETTGSLGRAGFGYKLRFHYGNRQIHLERKGCFVKHRESLFRLDAQTFAIARSVDAFNSMPESAKQESGAYIQFAGIKKLAEGIGAQIDAFVERQRVVIAPNIGLHVDTDQQGRISFSPDIPGVPQESLTRTFVGRDDVDGIFTLDSDESGRTYVVLNEEQREVLRRMQRVRRVGGAEKVEILRSPQIVFDGVSDSIDLSAFGPRVKGIGDFPFVSQPYYRADSGILDGDVDGTERQERKPFSAGLRCEYADGTVEDVSLASRDEILSLQREAQKAFRTGSGTIDFRGKSILVDRAFVGAINELTERVLTKPEPQDDQKPRRYLLIYSNEESLEYDPSTATHQPRYVDLEIPRALKDGTDLKPHQREGVKWLQNNFTLNRHGCLLADDMGLGKTLQVLTFLAWAIEKGAVQGGEDPERSPWNPILIVAPVILLENETWISDMRRFFEGEGAVFSPFLTLHGSTLSEFRRARQRETVIGEPVLDLERLRGYRVVLTNYETVVNYQHSFARMRDNWSIVVTDEAQEYKTPRTKISSALKSLAPRFRIACTGTPVETRLLDVWNIFDFLQPGSLLGSAAEFTERYEKRPAHTEGDQGSSTLDGLKRRLSFGRPDALLLRRGKQELLDLPLKHEERLECLLSSEQREWHIDLVARAKNGEHPLSIIPRLQKLYQHPALIPRYEPISTSEAIARCPKLEVVISQLQKIKRNQEKVLIFTRSLDMQQLLASVLGDKFGLEIDIINGAANRRGDTKSSHRTRKGILQRFRQHDGFNILVLSPDVAGIGLTLVEANHVFHYGRWWNPAREAQATDRAYRIGQERPVHVYHPIAKDPEGKFETFDEKLDRLITRRRALASEFLTPLPIESALESELLDDVLESAVGEWTGATNVISAEDVRRLTNDRFEALIAALEAKSGSRVILTPKSGDEGVDVIAHRAGEMRLIQCKHTLWDSRVDADVIADVINATDSYRARRFRALVRQRVIRPYIVTNGLFSKEAVREARQREVILVSSGDLLKSIAATPVSGAEVEEAESRRLASMRDVQIAIDRFDD